MQKDKVDEQLTYETYLENYKRRIQMRKQNFKQRQEDMFGGQRRTAQIKTIQKFIGKLKSDSKNYQAILIQLDTLNMSKYIEEVSNIIANSINEKQIIFYTQVATKLNISYENLPSIMIKDLIKVFNQQIQSQEQNKSKIKSIFLYTVELFVCGFSFSYKELLEMIKKVFKCGKNKKFISNSDIENKLYIYCYSCTIFSTLLAHFSEIFTKKQSQAVQIWKKQGRQVFKYPEALPLKTKDQLTTFFTKYVIQCFGLLKQVVQLIKKYESQLFECLRLDGEFNKQTQRNYVEIAQRYIVTKKHLRLIAYTISEPIQLIQLDIKITTIPEIMARYVDKADNAIIFQDQFQQQIYQSIPQLVTAEQKNVNDQQYRDFKLLLQNCKNVNDSNQIAKAFNLINNKKNRKSLAKDVLQYRKQYHLVTPYLCRVIAIINIHFKDIGETVNDLIFSQYDKIKDTQSTNFVVNDKKGRIMKYICEFTKFKVIQVQKTMNCIQNLIDNLNGFNIQLIVMVLENIGRFLHLSENSANRFTFLIKKYQNIIKKKSLPILTTSQLINSINLLKPRKQMQKPKQHPKSAEQIRAEKIMELCVVDNIDQLMNQIDDIIKTQEGFNAIKVAFLKRIQNYDFMSNYNYAYLLEELKHTKLSNFIVERTIQNFMLYLAKGQNQKTIQWSKFFAELFSYNLIKRQLLFCTIEKILKINTNQIGVIHVYCNILQTCGDYLKSKKVNRRNQRFLLLVQFKKFLFQCKYIPMLQQYQILQIFDLFQPDLCEIDKKVLEQFMQFIQNKTKNENTQIDYSEELDKYLSKKNLKKYEPKPQCKDTRGQPQTPEKIQKEDATSIVQQLKSFDKQFNFIMQENRKDYSSRIAKPVHLEKVFDKKKQKKKDVPCITVVGRSGNRFIKKDIAKKEQVKKVQ